MPKYNKYNLDYEKVVSLFQDGLSYEKAYPLCGFPNKGTFGRQVKEAMDAGIITVTKEWKYNETKGVKK